MARISLSMCRQMSTHVIETGRGSCLRTFLVPATLTLTLFMVLAGWEGSAHDGRVLADAQAHQGFDTVAGKYWLGDAGYGNSECVLAPYRGVRYHLKEQYLADQKYTAPTFIIHYNLLMLYFIYQKTLQPSTCLPT